MLDEYSDVLSVEDGCKILNISRNTMYRLLKEGTITAVRCGKKWRISKKAIIDYINCGKKF